ncbi:HlyD family type I secretion periplasmic adaptor subunit [Rhizobium sp. LEGMi135b]
MNQVVKPPKRPAKPQRRSRTENEFLPAALEILETPASPVRTAFIWFIAIVVTATLLWSYFGTFDIVSTAQGKIQPTGRVKVIQSIEVGKVRSIPVTNGSHVKAGDIVVQLDDTELKSDEEAIAVNLQALRAEIARRDLELATARRWLVSDFWSEVRVIPVDLSFDAQTPVNVQTRERTILTADLSSLSANLDNLTAQRSQSQATIERLGATIDARKTLIATLAQRVTMRSSLVDQAAGSKSNVIDALQSQQSEETDLAEQVGQLSEARAALAVATSEGRKAVQTFIADNAVRQGDASRQADELEKQLIKASKRRQSMTIASPIDGIVTASALTTVGQVVNPGAELMRIVPADTELEIEAFLPNKDIGFVATGQEAVIKIEAFPFTRYGVLHGHVTSVATDAVPEPDAQQMEGEPAKQLQSLIPFGNVQRMQNLVFPVTIRLDVDVINVDGLLQPLSPGMAATVEIRTGKRRILEYLFSPLAEVASEAMQER